MAYSVNDINSSLLSNNNYIDALIKGAPRWWLNKLGTENVIRFAFPGTNVEQATYGSAPSNYQPFNSVQKDSARKALAEMTKITGVNFQEVADPAAADLFFGQASLSGTGVNRYHSSYSNSGGTLTNYRIRSYVYLATGSRNQSPTVGTSGYETLLHEIGHAMGLKHPFDGTINLPSSQDNNNYTVMSYNRSTPRSTYAAFDITALRYLYGTDGLFGQYGMAPTNTAVLLSGTSLSETIVGGAKNERMLGGAGTDRLNAGGGADVLVGGAGADTLTGGAGNDRFRYAASAEGGDTITDFVAGADKIEVSGPNFGGLTAGALATTRFALNGPKDTDDHFVFNTTSRQLAYDADGSGSGAAVVLATLNTNTLSAGDMIVAST